MSKNITLEQSLQAYRVLNTPAKYSWKKHWADEEFSNIDIMLCDNMEKKQFAKRLRECDITICDNIKATSGKVCNFIDLISIIRDDNNESNIKGIYPVGEGAGYAGGITTAAVDGIKTFEKFASIYKN